MTAREPFRLDLRPFMPIDWRTQIREGVLSVAQHFETERTLSTLGYDDTTTGVDMSSAVRTELYSVLPWVKGLYEDLVPVLLGQMGYGGKLGDPRVRGQQPILAIDDEHAVSANVMSPHSKKKGMEWHRDGADVKLALIMTTDDWDASTGGRLMVYLQGKVVPFKYKAGCMNVLEASEIPHAVETLRVDRERVNLMFNYTNNEQKGWRAEGESESFYNISNRIKQGVPA